MKLPLTDAQWSKLAMADPMEYIRLRAEFDRKRLRAELAGRNPMRLPSRARIPEPRLTR